MGSPAQQDGVSTTADGIDGLVTMPEFNDTKILFDATSAGAHAYHDKVSREHGKTMIDMTPAAIGPYVVPAVNLDKLLDAPNINMVTCGGQATIPMVDAVKKVAHVHYAEIVASIASNLLTRNKGQYRRIYRDNIEGYRGSRRRPAR